MVKEKGRQFQLEQNHSLDPDQQDPMEESSFEVIIKKPIEIVADEAKSQMRDSLKRFEEQFVPQDEGKRKKRKGVLDRALFNLQFVNFIMSDSPALSEYIERRNKDVNLAGTYAFFGDSHCIEVRGKNVIYYDTDHIINVHTYFLTPQSLQRLFDEGKGKRVFKKFANLTGDKIIKKISKQIK